MPHTCDDCGLVMQSEGSYGLHRLCGHNAGRGSAGVVTETVAPAPGPSETASAACPDRAAAVWSLSARLERQASVAAAVPTAWRATPPTAARPVYGAGTHDPNAGAVVLALLTVVVVLGASIATGLGLLGRADGDSSALVDPAAPPVAPAGSHLVVRAADGFVIAVPDSFQEVPVSPAAVGPTGAMPGAADPALSRLWGRGAPPTASALFFAVEPGSGNNQLVQRINLAGTATLDDVSADALAGAYRSRGARDVSARRVHLGSGDALAVAGTVDAGAGSVRITQHVLVRGSAVWVLTYAQDGSRDNGAAAGIASTFGLTA